MDKKNLFIGEIFVRLRNNEKYIVEKRIGYKALMYIPSYGSYLSLSRHEEFYLGCFSNTFNDGYIKEGTLIPYLSFGKETDTNEEIVNNLKNKIQELILLKKKEEDNQVTGKNNKENYDKETRNDMFWKQKFELAKTYYEHFNNLEIPFDFKTTNGIDADPYGIALGQWLCSQKCLIRKGKLSEERVNLLESIGLTLEKGNLWMERRKDNMRSFYETKWQESYEIVKTFYEHHGNLEAEPDFKTINGIDYNKEGLCIFNWINKQIQNGNLNKLSKDKIKLLENIGVVFNINQVGTRSDKWFEKYKLICIFMKNHPNEKISSSFKTTNGIDYDEDGVLLGQWLQNQKFLYHQGKLSNERYELLCKIGVDFSRSYKKENKEETHKKRVRK